MNNQPERTYKLELDPKILTLLGPSLYTNIYYILAELIANAYDADAANVYIISKPDSIIVEDDGNGMSYEGTKKYLKVAHETRSIENDSYTNKNRRKIGRKGIGKLAALSVSENVWVQTIKNGEKSGFILTRNVKDDRLLAPLNDADMVFENIKKHGTSIIMKQPQYVLNKTLTAIKKNLLKIFPLINKDFQIHIIQNGEEEVINNFDSEIVSQLGCLIIIGRDFEYLNKHFKNDYNEKNLIDIQKEKNFSITLKNKEKKEKEYELIIKGWVGAYKTTRGRKTNTDDFPDNFISLLSNNKLGEYNILPIVGKNKLHEVYVVGQLHVDLFEETELPDMALSNRQGYKTDDERYKKVISYVATDLLPDIINKRSHYANCTESDSKRNKLEKQKKREEQFKEKIDTYKEDASSKATNKIAEETNQTDEIINAKIKEIIKSEMNKNLPIIGIKKQEIDAQKKKILICHTKKDKVLADIIYELMLFNRIPPEDIIYTSCNDQVSRIPEDIEVYEYLRKFFVESYSDEKIYVIYVTSKNMAQSWGAITEVGAGWITRTDHKIFNIAGHTPNKPLNDGNVYHTSVYNIEDNSISMDEVEYDKFTVKIENICDQLGYTKRTQDENKRKLKEYVNIIS